MMKLTNHVLHWLDKVAQEQEVTISDIKLNFDEVITDTGPSALTMATQNHRRMYRHTKERLDQEKNDRQLAEDTQRATEELKGSKPNRKLNNHL